MFFQTTVDLRSEIQNNPPGGFTAQLDLGKILTVMLRAALLGGALLVLLYFVWGAISWITAGGDKGKLEEARNRIAQAAIGLAVLAASLALFLVVQYVLGIDLIKIGKGSSSTKVVGGSSGITGPTRSGSSKTGDCATKYGSPAYIGDVRNDQGAGKYCWDPTTKKYTNAQVKCVAAGEGPAGYSWPHYEPIQCTEGVKAWNWQAY